MKETEPLNKAKNEVEFTLISVVEDKISVYFGLDYGSEEFELDRDKVSWQVWQWLCECLTVEWRWRDFNDCCVSPINVGGWRFRISEIKEFVKIPEPAAVGEASMPKYMTIFVITANNFGKKMGWLDALKIRLRQDESLVR